MDHGRLRWAICVIVLVTQCYKWFSLYSRRHICGENILIGLQWFYGNSSTWQQITGASISRLAGLLLLLLEDVVGGVKDGLHRLAVVLLLAVAEVQGALAAQLQFRRIIVMKVVKKRRERRKNQGDISGDINHLLLADLASRKPTGTGNWPEDEDASDIEDYGHLFTKWDCWTWGVDEDDDGRNSPIALADLGSHIDAQSYDGSRHPNHSSEDEKTKLGHFLLAFQGNCNCVLSLKRFGTEWRNSKSHQSSDLPFICAGLL